MLFYVKEETIDIWILSLEDYVSKIEIILSKFDSYFENVNKCIRRGCNLADELEIFPHQIPISANVKR